MPVPPGKKGPGDDDGATGPWAAWRRAWALPVAGVVAHSCQVTVPVLLAAATADGDSNNADDVDPADDANSKRRQINPAAANSDSK